MDLFYTLDEYFDWKLSEDIGALYIYFIINFYKVYNSVY
jgi:hypothetical protein